MFQQKKGQNIFEYSLLFVIVVTVLIVFLGRDGTFVQQVNQSFDDAINFIGKELHEESTTP